MVLGDGRVQLGDPFADQIHEIEVIGQLRTQMQGPRISEGASGGVALFNRRARCPRCTLTTSDLRIEILGGTTKHKGRDGSVRRYRIVGARTKHQAVSLDQTANVEQDGLMIVESTLTCRWIPPTASATTCNNFQITDHTLPRCQRRINP
ncbi:hypothetical protein [Nocardia beijingensis]